MAYATPYILTKMDIAALKQATHVGVRYSAADDTRVRAIKEQRPTEKEPFRGDVEHVIPAPVTIAYNYSLDTSRAHCSALVWVYASQHDHAASVLSTLRAGDGVVFQFYPDCHTNGYMRDAGIHSDVLRLLVFRNAKEIAQWELDTRNTPENSARMCQGTFEKMDDAA